MSFVFDANWDDHFKASPFRLRYELGGKLDNIAAPIPRFVQALIRSRAIAQSSFAESKELWAIVGSWGTGAFEELAKLGFRGNPFAEWGAALDGPDNSEESGLWRAFDVTGDEAACDAILWASIVNEMPIAPKAPVDCYLADMDRGILLHIYDDRGMDVTALAPSSINGLRDRFDNWLLPFDRARIGAAFAL